MKFSVGYQIDPRGMFVPAILRAREKVNEVYFAYGDFPNGRHRQTRNLFLSPEEANQRQLSDLQAISDAGIGLNLLLNANCYGENSLARSFYEDIGYTVDYLDGLFGLKNVTTTSPIIAKFIKNNFPHIGTRASVNMEIGTAVAMEHIKDCFDSFYLRRELNRDIDAARNVRKWCDKNGKQLFMLANSGCLSYCPLHNFHDNLVAHEEQIAKKDNAFEFHPICRERISKKETAHALLCESNFVRPEDIHLYEGIFDGAKLATRVSNTPIEILMAYTSGRYTGNLASLLEPDHSGAIYPYVLENSLIPEGFGEQISKCKKNCAECGYCENVFKKAIRKINQGVYIYANESND